MERKYSQYNELYRGLVEYIFRMGDHQEGRNGDTLVIPHYSFVIDKMGTDNKMLLRKMHYKGIQGEFDTLMDTTRLKNKSQFEANGCNYWDNWAGPDGSLNLDYHNMMHPQLERVIEKIKNDPGSRRHHVELWNPERVHSNVLSLTCCWHGLTFIVINDTLHMTWTQRSVDTMIGLPSDVYLASLFMKHVAYETGLAIGGCMFSLSNVHIYKDHIENAEKLAKRSIDDFDNPLKFKVIA